jgi:hypothetical protein
VDFAAERLSAAINDDHLIAAVIDHMHQTKERVYVATADIGLTVKLRGRSIPILSLPDDLRLSVDDDPLVQENMQLKRQLARIQARMSFAECPKCPTMSITTRIFGGTQRYILSPD